MDVWVVWAHIEGLARFLSQRNWAFYRSFPFSFSLPLFPPPITTILLPFPLLPL